MIPDFLTIAEAANLIEKRKLSPIELVESCLQRIKTIDGQLNSFIHVLADEARASARIAESEISSGHYKGPLHGIPIGLKDVYETQGIPTTCHSKIMMNHIPKADAYSVMRLKQAGAIIMGKLATHEFALGGPSFDLPWPPARNPWDITRFTGGSSSGTGASVAAGLVLGGAASDAGGSIRTPAAYCGVAGIKPTFGLISRKGILPLSFSLDHAGIMAWTAEDCAILLQVMAGFDPNDPVSANHPIPDYRAALTTDVKGLRIGFLRHFYTTDTISANTATCDAIDAAAKKFEEMGCSVQEVQMFPLTEWAACGTIIMFAEAYALHESNLRTRFTDYGEVFRDRMALAALITSADYIHAMHRRRELIDEFEKVMANFDIILTATVRSEAPKIEAVGKFSIFERPLVTMPFNVTGSPAMSVCCGYTDGLPLAMQIIGKRFEDATVLRLANAYEKSTPWRKKRPSI